MKNTYANLGLLMSAFDPKSYQFWKNGDDDPTLFRVKRFVEDPQPEISNPEVDQLKKEVVEFLKLTEQPPSRNIFKNLHHNIILSNRAEKISNMASILYDQNLIARA